MFVLRKKNPQTSWWGKKECLEAVLHIFKKHVDYYSIRRTWLGNCVLFQPLFQLESCLTPTHTHTERKMDGSIYCGLYSFWQPFWQTLWIAWPRVSRAIIAKAIFETRKSLIMKLWPLHASIKKRSNQKIKVAGNIANTADLLHSLDFSLQKSFLYSNAIINRRFSSNLAELQDFLR